MNILIIASYLPIANYSKHNSIVFDYINLYKKRFTDVNFIVIRPVIYIPFFLKFFSNKWKNFYNIRKARHYKEDGIEIFILSYFSIRRIKCLNLILSSTIFFFNKNKIENLIKNIDVIHAQEFLPDGILANLIKKKFKIPYILTVRKISKYTQEKAPNDSVIKIINQAHTITTLNKRNLELLNKFCIKNVKLIPHGLINDFYYDKPLQAINKYKILSVGSLIKLKNFDKAIIALSKIKNQFNFTYTIYGEGPEYNNLVNLIQDLEMTDLVSIHNKIPYFEMPFLYRDFDIFVMVSAPETFGRVYIEAMAASIPIICAKNNGIDGLFKDNYEGIAVDVNNNEALIQKFSELMSDVILYQTLSKNSYVFAKKFKWEYIIEQYKNIYSSAILDEKSII